MFQSTPVIANGRIIERDGIRTSEAGFNPRPLLLTGESSRRRLGGCWMCCFNPRPLLLTGESEFDVPVYFTSDVSIHARYC